MILEAAAIGLQAAGTAANVYNRLWQGDIARKAGRFNAWAAGREADRIRQAWGTAETQLEKKQTQRMSALSAMQTELGGGKSEETMLNTQGVEDAIEHNMLASSAISQITSTLQEGNNALIAGKAAHNASIMDARTSVLTGAGKLMGQLEGSAIEDKIKSMFTRGQNSSGAIIDLVGNGSSFGGHV